MAASINNSAWLEWITALVGGKSRQAHAATFPPDRFYCLLDELPLHLVPRRTVRAMRVLADGELFLSPDCMVRRAEDLPEETASSVDFLSAFALQGTIAWVRDTVSGSLLPFWLGPELESLVRELRPGELVPNSVPAEVRSVLAEAGILIPAEVASDKQRQIIEDASAPFRQKGYAPLSSLIHPFHVAALRRYYRHLIRTGAITLGDQQSARRYVAHNEPVAQFFHQLLAPTLSAVAGERLKPSYVYMASYLSGAELKKHTDREQCDFSITLCLDFAPEPALATPWPIKLDTPTGTVTVHQALGDGLAYRGARLPHYRAPLGEGQTSTSIFFHYVSADFTGTLG
jgi:hypothetical protein